VSGESDPSFALLSRSVCVETIDGDQRAVTGRVLTPESPIKIKRDCECRGGDGSRLCSSDSASIVYHRPGSFELQRPEGDGRLDCSCQRQRKGEISGGASDSLNQSRNQQQNDIDIVQCCCVYKPSSPSSAASMTGRSPALLASAQELAIAIADRGGQRALTSE
jgi:hypothetical protein